MFASRSRSSRARLRLFVRKPRRRERLTSTGRRVVLTAVTLAGVAYVGAPYVTIWRLASALQEGDTGALEASVDWNDVREGIKEDIADGITASDAAVRAQSNDLPGFGDSFIKNIAADMVDREIKPQQMSAVFRKMQHTGNTSFASFLFNDVRYAFFDGTDHFLVSFTCPGQEAGDPVQVEMTLQHYAWKVVRVRVPGSLSGLTSSKRT